MSLKLWRCSPSAGTITALALSLTFMYHVICSRCSNQGHVARPKSVACWLSLHLDGNHGCSPLELPRVLRFSQATPAVLNSVFLHHRAVETVPPDQMKFTSGSHCHSCSVVAGWASSRCALMSHATPAIALLGGLRVPPLQGGLVAIHAGWASYCHPPRMDFLKGVKFPTPLLRLYLPVAVDILGGILQSVGCCH